MLCQRFCWSCCHCCRCCCSLLLLVSLLFVWLTCYSFFAGTTKVIEWSVIIIRKNVIQSTKLKNLTRSLIHVLSRLRRFTTNQVFSCESKNGTTYLCHSDRCKMWINESFISVFSDLPSVRYFSIERKLSKKGFEQRQART